MKAVRLLLEELLVPSVSLLPLPFSKPPPNPRTELTSREERNSTQALAGSTFWYPFLPGLGKNRPKTIQTQKARLSATRGGRVWPVPAQTPALSLCRSLDAGLTAGCSAEVAHCLSNTNTTFPWGLPSSLHSLALEQTFGRLSGEDREQGWGVFCPESQRSYS